MEGGRRLTRLKLILCLINIRINYLKAMSSYSFENAKVNTTIFNFDMCFLWSFIVVKIYKCSVCKQKWKPGIIQNGMTQGWRCPRLHPQWPRHHMCHRYCLQQTTLMHPATVRTMVSLSVATRSANCLSRGEDQVESRASDPGARMKPYFPQYRLTMLKDPIGIYSSSTWSVGNKPFHV